MTNTNPNAEIAKHISIIYKTADKLRRNQIKVPVLNLGALRIGNEENYWEIKSKQDDAYNLVVTNYNTSGYTSGLETLMNERGSFLFKRYIGSPISRPSLNKIRESYSFTKIKT